MGKVRKEMPKAKVEQAPRAQLSKYIQKTKDKGKTKRDNTYVFTGFYDRLKSIDVKHAHSGLSFQSHLFDHLQDDEFGNRIQDRGDRDKDDMSTSNFIQLLRSEKFKNHTQEFNKVFKQIETLCFSYPLLILNKAKVVQKLIDFINDKDFKSVQTIIMDLFIALIKDMRQDVYEEFLHQILPTAINLLDAENLQTMDKVFQLLSFAFKFLIKPIRENIRDVFSVYIVLLEHKNRFIRKFSAQSFSFVLRKVTIDQEFVNFMIGFLDEEGAPVNDRVNGLSELIFEVVSGHGDELHSKGGEFLGELLSSDKISTSQNCRQTVQILLLKLVNAIDVKKLSPIFEDLVTHLGKSDDANRLTLLFKVFNQSVALKFGRRIDMASLVVITQALNNLVQKQAAKLKELPTQTRAELGETLGLIYYFKFGNVMQIYAKGKLDFATAKTAFTTGIFGLVDDSDTECKVLRSFYSLLMQQHDQITAKERSDLDVDKILHLKQSTAVTQFSEESHQKKAKLLLQPLTQSTIKSLVKGQAPTYIILSQIGLLVKLIQVSGHQIQIELNDKAVERIRSIKTEETLTDYQNYTLAKFIKLTNQCDLLRSLFLSETDQPVIANAGLRIGEIVENNIVLRAYGDQLERSVLESSVQLVFDLQNKGYSALVKSHTQSVIASKLELTCQNCSDLITLKSFAPAKKVLVSDNQELFLALNRNLSKNSTELRKATLKVLNDLFVMEKYLVDPEKAKVDSDTVRKFYTGDCPLLPKLLEYENIRLAFETERTRGTLLTNVEVQIASGLVTPEYLDTVYHLMIGSLWLKFTPGYKPAMSILQEIMIQKSEVYLERFMQLFENVGHLTQFVNEQDNDVYESFLAESGTLIRHETCGSIFYEIYQGDAVADQSYIHVKDFHFNLCKTLQPIVDRILISQDHKGTLFGLLEKFYENEYSMLHHGRTKDTSPSTDVKKSLVQANMVDSDEFKAKRRTSYGKLCALAELFGKASALNKLSPAQTQKLIEIMTRLLSSQESSLQKNALTCLLKCSKKTTTFNNTTAKLPKYAKLLEGLADDLKFRNMIPIINLGSSDAATTNKAYIEEGEYEGAALEENKESKRNIKGQIPKLEKEDRQELLPYVIKLLFSKLVKKKGAINKNNSIGERRNIVYIFLSSLEPVTEFPLFFKELLQPLDLQNLIDEDEMSNDEIEQKLLKCSFNQYAYFIQTIEIIFKQLGTLLSHCDFLGKMSRILTLILSLSKKFNGHLQESDRTEEAESETNLYRFVGKQSKMCLRKGLKIAKQLFARFAYDSQFTTKFTAHLYSELIEDQLPELKQRYISEKSQLVEILTTGWSSQPNCRRSYLEFPQILPSVISMLQSQKIDPDNVVLILDMLKNIVEASLDDQTKTGIISDEQMDTEGIDLKSNDDSQSDSEMSVAIDEVQQVDAKDVARQIIQQNVQAIGQNLHIFWSQNQTKLRQAIQNSGQQTQNKSVQGMQIRERSVQLKVLSNLTFVVSELSAYLSPDQATEALSFLEMIVSLVSSKGILQASTQNSGFASNRQNRNEDLLVFGCGAINALLKTLFKEKETAGLVSESLLNRILQMMLHMESKRARETFTEGLQNVLKDAGIIQPAILIAIQDMNKTKKGMADVTLDFEKVLGALNQVNGLTLTGLNAAESSALLFNVLNLLLCDEYSVRDYAQHSVSKLIEIISDQIFLSCEKWILTQIKINRNELTVKSVLATFKLFIARAKANPIKGCVSGDLYPLIFVQKNEEDFLSNILSMQIQQRQKALRKLVNIQKEIEAGSFRKAVLPLVDYLIFDLKSHLQNRRNTVRYSREQTTQLMEDALNVYVAYTSRLSWVETFKLIRKFLFKIERVQRQTLQYSSEKEDQELEKTVTKSLCKVLEGLALNENIALPDAVKVIELQAKERELAHPEWYKTDFSNLLDELVGQAKAAGADMDDELVEELESDHEEQEEEKGVELDIIQIDKKMAEPNRDQIEMRRQIQMKLQRKVLPVLQRHLFEAVKSNKQKERNAQEPIRSFVAVAIAKIIRKLPIQFFRSQLQKLINLIVNKGLRSSDLNIREKARRALIKVLAEVSPRFLQIVFNELSNNLNRGFHAHVNLYTVHYVLNHLTGKNKAGEQFEEKLQPGMITSTMIHSMSDLLMRELFGDMMEERMLVDTQKKHIKESKAQKAIPIFEVLTQYIDFKRSFLDLIAPIVKVLEENPSFVRIQQCEELLNKISTQLLKNETLSGDQLLIFLYSIVERGIGMTVKTKVNDEKAPRDYGAKVDNLFTKKTKEQLMEESHGIQIEWVKTHQHVSKKKTDEVCGRVLANFGLQCLRKALKQKGLILIGDEHEQRALATIEVKQELKDKLDPFVVLLLRALKTFYNPIIVTTLHILVNIIHLGLPAFGTLLKKFLTRIFKLFNGAQSSDEEFLNTLFRCVTELIKTYSVYTDLSETQIKTLVLIIKANVSNFSTQSHVFQCLKSIINRKFLCPDLYDLMETVEEMMVTNIQKTTRSICANIFVQFILEYPLAPERIQQHINHMLKNLTYFDTDGRLQLLEVFQTFVDRFPVNLLDNYSELFFFTLFLRLVNDPAQKCRDKVAMVLKKLISKTSLQRSLLETVFKIGHSVSDAANSDPEKQESLLAGKLQLLQIFAESGKLTNADIERTVAVTGAIVTKHAKIATKLAQRKAQATDEVDELEINPENADFLKGIDLGDSSEDEEANVMDLTEDGEAMDESEARWSKAYMSISSLENLFLSCKAEQVIAAFGETLGQDIVTLAWRHENFWVKLACQRLLGHMFSSCLQKQNFSDVFGDVFAEKENLLKLIYQMLSVFNSQSMNSEMANQLVKSLTFLQGQLLQKCDQDDDDTYVKAYKKASFIGRKIMGEITESSAIKLEALVQFFAVSVKLFATQPSSNDKLDNAYLRNCLTPILELVHRTHSDEQMVQSVREISTELVDQLSTNLEKKFFISIYSGVQRSIEKNRMERKMKTRLLVGTSEGQQIKARKRIAKTIRKKEKRTEKAMQYTFKKHS